MLTADVLIELRQVRDEVRLHDGLHEQPPREGGLALLHLRTPREACTELGVAELGTQISHETLQNRERP